MLTSEFSSIQILLNSDPSGVKKIIMEHVWTVLHTWAFENSLQLHVKILYLHPFNNLPIQVNVGGLLLYELIKNLDNIGHFQFD